VAARGGKRSVWFAAGHRKKKTKNVRVRPKPIKHLASAQQIGDAEQPARRACKQRD
jgi:hypothetical protein